MESKLYDEIIRIEKEKVGCKRYRRDKYQNDYLESYKENIIEEMSQKHISEYGEGQGGELKDGQYPAKMSSLRSSSAMTFNMLGNESVRIKANRMFPTGDYSVQYEKKIPTIKEKDSNIIHKANLDAYLYNKKEEAIFCEMKMAEWMFNPQSELKEAYSKKENYLNQDAASTFTESAKALSDSIENGTLRRYDAWQMFKHTLACFNEIIEKPTKRVTLLNVVWEVPADQLSESVRKQYIEKQNEEWEGFRAFRNIMMNPRYGLQELFFKHGVVFTIEYMSAKQFINLLEKTDEEIAYLKRYTLD